jgi:TrmH family RNA methyltransferase
MIETIKHPILEKIKHLKGSNTHSFLIYGHHIQWLHESNNSQYTVEAVIGLEKKSPWPWKYYQVKPSVFHHIIGHNRENFVALIHVQNHDKAVEKNLIILDQVQDYGNIGSIIRNSFMMDSKDFFIINRLNIFHIKTIEASRGLIFYSNIIIDTQENAMEYVKNNNLLTVMAGFQGSLQIPKENIALILGNETHGYNPQWESMDHNIITIPQINHSSCDSINVAAAAGILVFIMNNN